MKVIFCLVVFTFSLVYSSEVTLSCGADDVTRRGFHGIPGRRGRTGEKGEQGLKGSCNKFEEDRNDLKTLSARSKNLEAKLKFLKQSLDRVNSSRTRVSWKGCLTEGINSLLINGKLIEVYCEVNGDDSWMVFQKRYSGEVNFYKDWEAYKTGFGNLNGEFWLGLENLHIITSSGSYKLRVDLEDWDGNTRYGEYSTFSVENSTSNYRLNVGGYTGTAGDALAYHNGQQFTTKDQDNDQNLQNCAKTYHGAWWYNTCYHSNLNGNYINNGGYSGWNKGITWNMWKGSTHSMKKATMKIQPVEPKQ